MQQFISASPAAAAKLGQYSTMAQRMIGGEPAHMAKPPATQMFNEGGLAEEDAAAEAKALAERSAATREYQRQLIEGTYADPTSVVTQAEAPTVQQDPSQLVDPSVGQLTGPTPTVDVATAPAAAQALTPEQTQAVTFESLGAAPGVQQVTDATQAATGTVSAGAQVDAAQMDPEQLQQLGLDAAQIAEAQRVAETERRQVEQGELISGPTVDMARVEENIAQTQAAQATPTVQATVQGQLEQLMQQFEGTEPPAWAAGAMRAATAQLASRGLGASSMAGQAVVQAAMESALPIATADAQTIASFEAQNLSNRQQVAMMGAQMRAQFLGVEFDQSFQARVANAARIADIANMNFTADVQVALENARLAQSVDLANLDARQAKVMADAAAMTNVDLSNLNNRQQAAVQNAAAFLQMDMSNLNNQQQTLMFNSQARIQALLTDTAAENAARQINAASQQQADQFNASLAGQISQFNAGQTNAINQFNAGEANVSARFNAELENGRSIFEAQNGVAIAQANAQWRQQIATTNTAAQLQVNMQNALAATGMTTRALDNLWQRERDMMNYAFTAAESELDRMTTVAVAKLSASERQRLEESRQEFQAGQAAGAARVDLVNTGLSFLASIW